MKKFLKIVFLTRSNLLSKIVIDTFFITILLYLFSYDLSNENIIAISILFILSGLISGIYKSFYRYSNFLDLIKISISSIIIVLLYGTYKYINYDLEVSNLILIFNILIFGSFFPRIFIKYCFNLTQTFDVSNNVAIYGAGDAGIVTKRSLFGSTKYKPVFLLMMILNYLINL